MELKEDYLVQIRIPAYRRGDIFSRVLNSILNQTYKNIELVIFDNSLADGYDEIKKLVEECADKRVKYFANSINLGGITNYKRCFDYKGGDFFIVGGSDVIIPENAVEEMLKASLSLQVPVIQGGKANERDGNLEHILFVHDNFGVFDASTIIHYFYSRPDSDTSFMGVNIFGCLINSTFYESAQIRVPPYSYHGCEEYLTMSVVLYAKKIAIIETTTCINLINNLRYDDTHRPDDFYTRFEPVLASNKFINDYEGIMLRKNGFYVHTLRKGLLLKCWDFLRKYDNYSPEVLIILLKNLFHLGFFSLFKGMFKILKPIRKKL